MIKAVVVIIVGLILACVSMLTKTNSHAPQFEGKSIAQITNLIYSDSGNIKYYLSYQVNGKPVEAQSPYYVNSGRKYHIGDTVTVNYYFTEAGKPRAMIDDEELVTCAEKLRTFL